MTKTNKVKGLNIGDMLYTGSVHKTLSYKVYEKRETADSVFYAVECQECNDHPKCRLLVAPKSKADDSYFVFAEMINNYDDYYDEDDCNCGGDESYWHEDEKFFRDKYSGVMQRVKKSIKYYEDEIDKYQRNLKHAQEQLEKTKEIYEQMATKQKNGVE